jgi:hypothetical protein
VNGVAFIGVGRGGGLYRRAPFWLVIYLSLFGSLFLTNLDVYAATNGLLPFNSMLLFLGVSGLFPLLLMVVGELLTAADRMAEALLRNVVPLSIFILWIVGHVLFVARAMLSLSDIDFVTIFPVYQLLGILIGMGVTAAHGFPRAFATAGKVTLLVLGTSILVDNFSPGTLSDSALRGGGFAHNSNVAAFNMVAVLTMSMDFRRFRLTDALILILTGGAVFVTMSRSGLTQFALVVCIYTWCQIRRSILQQRLLPIMGGAIIVIVLAISVSMLDQLVAGSALGENEEVRYRLGQLMFRGATITDDPYRGVLYQHYFGLVMERPFLGYGTGYTLNVAVYSAPLGVGPHSMYLRTWIDTGLWGLLTYSAFLISVLITLVHRRFVNGVIFVLMVVLYGFFSHNLIDSKTCMVVLGIALGLSLRTESVPDVQ